MKLVLMIVLFTLASCASHSEMAEKEPVLSFYSVHSSEDVKVCIENAWADEYTTLSTKAFKTKTGYRTVMLNGYGGVLILANTIDKPTGSYTTIHEHAVSILSKDTFGVVVELCK